MDSYGELSKQFTDVVTPIPFCPTMLVAQLVGGFPVLLNVLTSYCPVTVLGKNMSYEPLIATSPGKHDTVELALKETKIYYCQKIEFIICRFLLFHI